MYVALCQAISRMTHSAEVRTNMGREGAIDAVTGLMTQFPLSVDVQYYGCGALQSMMLEHPTNRDRAGTAGTPAAVVAAGLVDDRRNRREHMDRDVTYQTRWATTLVCLLRGADEASLDVETPHADNQRAVGEAGGLGIVVRVMEGFPQEQAVQRSGCEAISLILSGNPARFPTKRLTLIKHV